MTSLNRVADTSHTMAGEPCRETTFFSALYHAAAYPAGTGR
ncbi:MAG: hypothetical protein P8166_08810 [Candidatus Thiodiazotropha sp.]